MLERDENSLKDVEYLKRFLKRKASDEQHRTSIVTNKFDQRDMERAMKEVEQYREMENEMSSAFPDTGSPAAVDMFQAFNKPVPVLRDEDEMKPESLIERELMKELMNLREFTELTDYTTSDPVAAAMASTTMKPKATEILTRLQERQDEINEMLDRLNSEDPPTEDELQEMLESLGDELGPMRTDLREALRDATDEMEQMAGMSSMWGIDPGELRRMPAAERIALAKRIRDNPNLAKLAQLIGAFQSFAFAMQHRKTNQLQTDIYDLTVGNDLSHVVASEFALLKNRATKREFLRRYAERGLIQYRLHGREKVGKGGIVCAVDSSGSMSGERDVFAKAVALTLLRIAQAQNRSFHGILFGSRSEVAEFTLTDAGPEQVLDFASFFYGGGTDFESPLRCAMDYLAEEYEREGNLQSDIVFITDGYCGVSDQFMAQLDEFKQRLGCRIFGVAIGVDEDSEPLRTIADGRVWPIYKLNSPEDLKDIFREV